MAVTANSIITPQAPKTATAVATAAKTTYNDTANSVLLVTAGANGSRLTKLTAIPRATVTATQCQLFSSTDGGVTLNFITSVVMAAYTMAQTTACSPTDFGYTDANPLILQANERLYIGTGVALAGGIVFYANYADY